MTFSNCIDCQERYPGCHDHCQSYQEDSKYHKLLKEKIHEEQLGPFLLADRKKTSILQIKKRRRK